MQVDPKALDDAQDTVFQDPECWPKDIAGDEETFCNIASLHVANILGCHDFDAQAGRQPLLADQIYNLFQSSRLFTPIAMGRCQETVNAGALILAILPSWKLQQNDGHVCTLATGVGDSSGRWNAFTPFCMNLGRVGTCFRRKGVNWAFQIVPEFYLWTPLS